MPVVRNGVEAYQGDQLVVELEYAGLMQEGLRRLGISASELDSSAPLSLTLLSLSGVDTAAGLLRQDSALVESASRDQQAGQAAVSIGDLDLISFAVRQWMRQGNDGWVATFGKNRILDRVQGSPYIKGGVGEPDPAAPLSIPPVGQQTGARVAVLDTRLYAHPDLVGRFLGDSAATFGTEPLVTQGHSTFVAGLIAQRAPSAQLIVHSVLDDEGANANSWDVATAMASAGDAGVAVLNLSLGCATIDRVPPLSLRRAVERLAPSVVVVAAAGNNGIPGGQDAAGLTPATPIYPAAIDGVVAVGAYDPSEGTGKPAVFSPKVPWLDLLAPGVRVRSTFLPGHVQLVRRDPDGSLVDEGSADFGQPGYATWDGTSFAAANVSGAIAALTVAGRVSAYEALDQLQNPAGPGGDILPYGPA
jgi:Subtilase family